MKQAGLPAELLETRHVRTAFKIMPVKTDRKDARGIALAARAGPKGATSPVIHLPRHMMNCH